jgi:hypothetical protein
MMLLEDFPGMPVSINCMHWSWKISRLPGKVYKESIMDITLWLLKLWLTTSSRFGMLILPSTCYNNPWCL